MENIFKDAYFGKPYKTRNGEKALFQYANADCACLVTEEHCISYNFDGTVWGISEPEFDIISEWGKPITDEELNRLAVLYELNHDDIPPYANTDTVWNLIRDAYKAGCKEIMKRL